MFFIKILHFKVHFIVQIHCKPQSTHYLQFKVHFMLDSTLSNDKFENAGKALNSKF